MHYMLDNNIIVKAENAALTTKQTNKVILEYISRLPIDIMALDYGCGKLRHSIPLYKKVKRLVVIDSDFQIERVQQIDGIKTTVKEYMKAYMPEANLYTLDSPVWQCQTYEFILCSNVLSAIPDYDERQAVITNIKNMLNPEGKALISVQYSNSYFKTYQNNPNAIQYLDGWLIKKGKESYSFYGIINPEILIDICISSGLSILNKKQIDGSVYLEVAI